MELGADARRIEALYCLTDRLYHARSQQDMFDAALEAIVAGLRCDRASILLFDEGHVMRFVAWQGLSDGYRATVEGHSPWRAGDRDPQPVCLHDVANAPLDAALKRAVLEEGIHAAAFVPLCADGQLIGKFMTYYDVPHVFVDDEIDFSLTIARQLAFAIHRTRTEEALRQGERRFREMIDALPVAIYTTDAQGRLTHFNPAAVEFSGRVPQLGSDEWCVSWKLYTPDGQPLAHADCPMAVALREGRSVRGADAIAERPDGVRRWFTPYPTPMLDPQGRVAGGINMLLDITDRREAERDLREREERFRAFLTATSDIIFSMDADWGRMRFLHGKQFAVDTDEPTAQWLERYIPPEDRRAVLDAVRAAIEARGRFELEHRLIRADGSTGWVFSRAVPLFDAAGRITEWFGAARDVTSRRLTQLALAHQRRLYEAILTNTPDFAYVFDTRHRFIYANEGLLRAWGKTWEQAIGKTSLELGYEADIASLHDREIERVIATRQAVRGEMPYEGTAGRRIYDYLFVPVIGADGEVEAVAGTTRDITESREADRRKDEFLAVLAHELRNPLAPITNAVHLLRRDRNVSALQNEAVSIIARQTAQLTRLVNDLLEVSRITTGRIQLRCDWVPLADVVDSALQSVASLVEQNSHRLQVHLPDEPVWVHGDAARLEQVLVNLLNNAAKYTMPGGRIDVALSLAADEAVISVRDTGIGIEPQLLPRVFDLFTQAEKSLDRSHGGLGVGLSLVRNLVELHGGRVDARSEPGRGSEFIVRLPASRQPGPRPG